MKNSKKQAALHLATELNKIKCLQIMTKYCYTFNVELGGDHDRTALHLAAILDHDQCAKILVNSYNKKFSETFKRIPSRWVILN